MKKTLAILLLVCCLMTLSACGAKSVDAPSANKIDYGAKYIKTSRHDGGQPDTYYVVESNCLKYYRCNKSESLFGDENYVYHYEITYKYEVIDDGKLTYFFDSVKIYDDDNVNDIEDFSKRCGILTFSENVLAEDDTLYVRESYYKRELKNFGKTED